MVEIIHQVVLDLVVLVVVELEKIILLVLEELLDHQDKDMMVVMVGKQVQLTQEVVAVVPVVLVNLEDQMVLVPLIAWVELVS